MRRRYSRYQRGGSLYTPIGTLSRQLSMISHKNRKYVGRYLGRYHNQKGKGAQKVLRNILSIIIWFVFFFSICYFEDWINNGKKV